jgi:pyruvate,water dikinase
MSVILALDDARATSSEITGGKGSSLAKLIRAGFRVPAAFAVTTEAYTEFVTANNLAPLISELLDAIDHGDPAAVEAGAARIRDAIHGAPVPGSVADQIAAAYRGLGAEVEVAVRSSGTAEDLAEASFAGQHDTYLYVHGVNAVIDAVRRCWASLWTARAVSYRDQKCFVHGEVGLCVVIQHMVASDVSGVMFTANPITAATDEIVVNGSWGLGEGIVSGVVTPDQFIVAREGRRIKSRVVGSKEVRVVRDSETGVGTVTENVPTAERAVACLTDDQVTELANLGLRIQEHYEGFPQDIEWAFAKGTCYLLQSRDITGVSFSWDEDLERWRVGLQPAPSDDTVWTRAWADAVWPGAITPLYFSIRAEMFTRIHLALARLWGWEEVGPLQMFSYHKGAAYFNAKIEYINLAHTLPPRLRTPSLLPHMPKAWHKDILGEPWSWLDPLKFLARLRFVDRDHGMYRSFDNLYNRWINDPESCAEAEGLPPVEIRQLTDAELVSYLLKRNDVMKEWGEDLWTLLWIHLPLFSGVFAQMIQQWYDGEDKDWIFNDLITGLPNGSVTFTENLKIWELAQHIRASDELTGLFEKHQGAAFFEHLDDNVAGREFKRAYEGFLKDFAHRGHSDRDMYAKRRIEDPGIDYVNFLMVLISDAESPEKIAKELIQRREAAAAKVIESIKRQPLSALKIEAFKLLNDWMLRTFAFRDDERHFTDLISFSKKRAAEEIGRRLVERQILEGEEYYFLSKEELFELLRGRGGNRLAKAKIAARRRNWEAVNKEFDPPMYIRNGQYVDLDSEDNADGPQESGTLRGTGTSRGEVTGTARIVPTQADIARVQKGDIMITSATDPGWTPVFMTISGLVLETGGMLAHGSCLSREYGIPAIQIPGAMRLIEDGSTISVSGDTGVVRVLAGPAEGDAGSGQELTGAAQ